MQPTGLLTKRAALPRNIGADHPDTVVFIDFLNETKPSCLSKTFELGASEVRCSILRSLRGSMARLVSLTKTWEKPEGTE